MRIIKKLLNLCLFIFLLSACQLPVSVPDETVDAVDLVSAWFDAPFPGTVLAPPNPCQIVVHGSSSSGISEFTLSVNGEIKDSIPSPDVNATLVTLVHECDLKEPGNYLLQIQAIDNNGNSSNVAQTNLIILSEEIFLVESDPIEILDDDESETDDDLVLVEPTMTETPDIQASISFESVSSNRVNIGRRCDSQEITFLVQAVDPQGVKVVVIFYRLQGEINTGWINVSMTPIGNDLYENKLVLSELFPGIFPDNQSKLYYQAVLQNDIDDTSTRTEVLDDITFVPCGE